MAKKVAAWFEKTSGLSMTPLLVVSYIKFGFLCEISATSASAVKQPLRTFSAEDAEHLEEAQRVSN